MKPHELSPSPQLQIQKDALLHNLNFFKKRAPQSRILLPVKANAYGCGIETLFPFFQNAPVDFLGVANCLEAIELRRLGWQKPILLLGGFFPANTKEIVEYGITPSITDLWQIGALQDAVGNRKLDIHLKLDLGMGRIGVRSEDFSSLVALLLNAPSLRVTGIFTHFPHSGPEAKEKTLAHNTLFLREATTIIERLSLCREDVILHAANSYAAAFFPETHHGMVRPGILFYGYYQSEDDRIRLSGEIGVRPSLRLVAQPISVRVLKKGDGISYASLYHVESESETVAVLPLGYADGIPRALSNRVSFGPYPLRGRVTMDQIMLGNFDGASAVTLLGEGVPSLELWGELSQSFSYELMVHLGSRLKRVLA